MTTSHRFVVVGQSAGPSALIDPGDRVLVLSGANLTAHAHALFVLIDAPEGATAQVRQILTTAFRRGGPTDDLKPDEENDYLIHLLDRLSVTTDGRRAVVVAALWDRRGVLGASVGGGSVYLCREGAAAQKPVALISEAGHGARAARLPLQPGDRLVLGSSRLARSLEPREVPQIVNSYPTLTQAATWLATLAASRSKQLATALLVQPEVSPIGIARVAAPAGRAVRPGRPDPRLALLPIALIALLIAGLLAHPALGQLGTSPPSGPPVGLHTAVSGSGARLSWTPLSGATGYLVTLGPRGYRTGAPRLLRTGLKPDSSYAWRVQGIFGSRLGHPSATASFTIPPGTLPALSDLSASLTYPRSTEALAALCWKIRLIGQNFDLWIAGGPHQALTGPALRTGAGGSRCTAQALPRGRLAGRYAWRLAERKSGYVGRVSAWSSFWVRAAERPNSAPRRRATVTAQRPSVPALPAPTPFPAVQRLPVLSQGPTAIPQAPAPVYVAPAPQPVAPQPAPRAPAAPAPVAPKPVVPKPAPKAPAPVVPCPNPPLCG